MYESVFILILFLDKVLFAFLSFFPDKLSLSDFFQVSEFSMNLFDDGDVPLLSQEKETIKVSVLPTTQCHRCRRYLVLQKDDSVVELCDLCYSYCTNSSTNIF